MQKIKNFNGVLYWLSLSLLILNLCDTLFKSKIFALLTQTSFLNYFVGFFCFLVLVLSVISLFKQKLFFNLVPYNYYIVYILLAFILIVLAFSGLG